jgi:hypothetical protein
MLETVSNGIKIHSPERVKRGEYLKPFIIRIKTTNKTNEANKTLGSKKE